MRNSLAKIVIGSWAAASLSGAVSFNGKLPPSFEENSGQMPGNVQFLARTPGYGAAFDRDATVAFGTPARPDSAFLKMGLLDSDPRLTVRGEGSPVDSTIVYRGGGDHPSFHIRDYSAIRYRQVYPGIDWVWHFRDGALEFQFELDSGADPAAVRMTFTGSDRLRVDGEGNLHVDGGVNLSFSRPKAWQDAAGQRVQVPVAFRIDSGVVTFEVGAHDPTLPLTIDPTVLYSRYIGGAGYDAANAVATDSQGYVYITGQTSSLNFNSTATTVSRSVFITKLSPDATTVIYNVILASGGNDAGKAIAVDSNGNVWVAGVAGGSAFPVTSGAVSAHSSGLEDAFVLRLDSSGALAYSTYLGGGGSDVATSLTLDSSGNAYVAGYTSSVNFPTTIGAPQRTYTGANDAFLVKLAHGSGSLLFSTLLGGSGNDLANAVSVTATGTVCVAGSTTSPNLPVVNAIQTAYSGNGNNNGLLACLNSSATAWTTVTYLGGSGPAEANGMTADSSGNIYLVGDMYSDSKSSAGAYAAFAMKLTAGGASSVFTTLLAGSSPSSGTGISVDATGNIWLAGYTSAVDFPGAGSPAFAGYYDGFVTELGSSGSVLSSRYVGGSGDDRCMGLTLTQIGDPIVAGLTGSVDLPITTGTAPAPYNAFVMKLQAPAPPPQVVSVTPSSGSGSSQTFSLSFSDSSGASDLVTIQVLINGTFSQAQACSVTIFTGARSIYLYNDAGTALLGPVTIGASGTVQNSQCTVNPAVSSMTASGNTLTLNLAVSFPASFTGAKSIYSLAQTAGGVNSGWQTIGAWTVPVPAPQVLSVTPSSGSGNSQIFTFVFSDANGASDLSMVQMLVNRTLSGAPACYITVYPGLRSIYLFNDGGTALIGPVSTGVSGTVQNSQCTVNASASSITASGNNLTVSVALSFPGSYSGAKSVYALAQNAAGAVSGWQTIGSWTVPTATPQVVSVTPSSGTGSSQTFSLVLSDGNGASDISMVQMLINGTFTGAPACYVTIFPGARSIYLYNDTGTALVAAGASGTVQNGQCTVNTAASSITASGNSLTISLAVTFAGGFGGAKSVYALAQNAAGLTSGWQTIGAWSVPVAAPQAVSVTPASGSASNQTFSFVFSDGKGASDLSMVQMLINSTFSGAPACYVTVFPAARSIYLYNDTGAALIAASASGTVQNSQCTVNTATACITASGNSLTVNLAVSFAGGFGGAKNVYALAQNAAGLNSGWQTIGSWTVPAAAPQVVSVTPSSGTGSSQTFSLVLSDGNGASDISMVQMLINGTFSGAPACYVTIFPGARSIYLYNDTGTALIAAGASGTVQNGQCTVNTAASNITAFGNNLSINLAVTFAGGFGGAKSVYALAQNVAGLNSGWQTIGSWTVR